MFNYLCGLQIRKEQDRFRRQKYLISSIIFNLGLLFVFKYFTFFIGSVEGILHKFNIECPMPAFKILMPVGISFYTFRMLSYTIDVYKGRCEPEKHLGIFALYCSFFPLIMAGPIDRAVNLMPQFKRDTKFDYVKVAGGFRLILWGLFRKVVIADRLAIFVDHVYGNLPSYQGQSLIIATYFFTFQIYFDFSAYSDIAVGVGRTLGYDITDNFRRPYFADSIPKFWRRWHISLTSWFRDYLYIPLGGNRCSSARWYFNLFIVFVTSGLWHGANWNFIIWGALHGIWQIIWVSVSRFKALYPEFLRINGIALKLVGVFITFQLVSFGWIFFRAESLSDAVYVIKHIPVNLMNLSWLSGSNVFSKFELFLAFLLIPLPFIIEIIQRKKPDAEFLKVKPVILRWILYFLIVFTIVAFGIVKQSQFIYSQF